ncbi:HK97 family phage portal protein [Planifilum fimeticola]|uniref:HK97 family phage portal protein n=1 Tax=Planifilum fimeticola TaxID=201975 RepID=A0A2T0LC37_9BACL|nr:phage portal protein [Planifilum fimeticola]PRX39514.1 HK97 family phage portal protein [Planifilum fimeticola]
MRFIQRMKMAWNVLTGRYSGLGYDFTKWFSPSNIFAGKTSNTLATVETIFAAVSRLSNAMASLPLKLYQDYTPVNNPIADLLANSPNPNMTSFDFIRTMEVCRNTHGNAYALKIYDDLYQVAALLPLDPSRVEPVIEEKTRELWYEIEGDEGRYFVHNMDMIHVKHIPTVGQSLAYHSVGYKGISPIDVLKNTVDYDGKVRTFSLEQMNSAILASFILKLGANVSKEKKAEILNNFKEFYQANGGVIIQESGMEITPIERNIIDTKVFEVEKITRGRVATVFNMPVHMLGETEGHSYSSMEQLSLEFVQGTLIPIVRQYEQELNRKLLTKRQRSRGLGFKFNVNALLRGDIKTRGDFYFKGIRSGWFTPNEVRAYEELPPMKGGDKLYMSRDLTPIDQREGQPEQEREEVIIRR